MWSWCICCGIPYFLDARGSCWASLGSWAFVAPSASCWVLQAAHAPSHTGPGWVWQTLPGNGTPENPQISHTTAHWKACKGPMAVTDLEVKQPDLCCVWAFDPVHRTLVVSVDVAGPGGIEWYGAHIAEAGRIHVHESAWAVAWARQYEQQFGQEGYVTPLRVCGPYGLCYSFRESCRSKESKNFTDASETGHRAGCGYQE